MDSFFFIASKLFWAIARPETLLIALPAAGLACLLRGRTRTAALLLAGSVAANLAVAILPLGDLALAPLERSYASAPKLDQVAGIILLGGGEDPGASATWGEPALNDAGERYLATLELARRHPQAKVYFTGGSGSLTGSRLSEAVIARAMLERGGLTPTRLVMETQSRNTAENAALLRKQIPAQADGQWILVTSAFHMPRAMQSFCGAGWRDLVAWPTDYRSASMADGTGWNYSAHLDTLNRAAKEWVGLLAYRLSGRTTSCTDGPGRAGKIR